MKKKLALPARVLPTVFGPFGYKGMRARWKIKAEGDSPSPETPKSPKQPATPPPSEPVDVAPEPTKTTPAEVAPTPTQPPSQPAKIVPASELDKPEELNDVDDLDTGESAESGAEEDESTQEVQTPLTEEFYHLPQGSQGFLEAMKDDPRDNTPRLIFADFLEESGTSSNADLAELIRLQIKYPTGRDDARIPLRESDLYAYQAFDRMDELESEHPEWFAPWGQYEEQQLEDTPFARETNGAFFHRGLLTVIYNADVFGAALRRGGGPGRSFELVDTVQLFGSNPSIENIMAENLVFGNRDPWLAHVSTLRLRDNPSLVYISDRITKVIAHTGDSLRELDLRQTRIGSEEHGAFIGRLANSRHLDKLATLILSYNNLTPYSIDALIEAEHLRSLKILDLRGNNLSLDQRRALQKRYGEKVVWANPL